MRTAPRYGKGTVVIVGTMFDAEVVCIPDERYSALMTMHDLSDSGATWGDLRRRAPALYTELADRFTRGGRPRNSVPFSKRDISGMSDGDGPWPAAEMLEWMPEDVQEQFGSVTSTMLNGDYLHIDVSELDSLVAALERHGFVCRRDDRAIEQVCFF